MAIKCNITGKSAHFYIGVARARKYKPAKIVGTVHEDIVLKVIDNLLKQAFSSYYWPVVMNMEKEIIYHSFDADQEKLSARLGWELKQKELKSK